MNFEDKPKVWNMYLQEWVELRKWMKYAPYIWTKGITQNQWEVL